MSVSAESINRDTKCETSLQSLSCQDTSTPVLVDASQPGLEDCGSDRVYMELNSVTAEGAK